MRECLSDDNDEWVRELDYYFVSIFMLRTFSLNSRIDQRVRRKSDSGGRREVIEYFNKITFFVRVNSLGGN